LFMCHIKKRLTKPHWMSRVNAVRQRIEAQCGLTVCIIATYAAASIA
jgi:hypothetical protein